MQSKLESFFKIKTTYSNSNKKCFVYDPENRNAQFVYQPDESDVFICIKSNIKLFYRKPKIEDKSIYIPVIHTNLSVPLLKSNLQKAIRRHNNKIALSSSIALLNKEPIEFLRRLPIIFVEDVCLLDSLPIIIWLMMVDKEYKLTNQDIYIILDIVNNLCDVKDYFDYDNNIWTESYATIDHSVLQSHNKSSELLSLYYRSLYGGMGGDIKLLQSAINYYKNNPDKIHTASYNNLNLQEINTIEVIEEAIDFHPLPQMLQFIKQFIIQSNKNNHDIDIDKETIKKCIWFSQSGINLRKPSTIKEAELNLASDNWKLIEPGLNLFRRKIMTEYM